MIIVMSRQGVLTVGEALKTIALPIRSLDSRQSGEGFPSHSVAPCEILDLWVIVSLYKGGLRDVVCLSYVSRFGD